MPKTFSDNERAHIRKRLIEEAKQCLVQYGIRKTTVDELVKRVNIPKGTFYLFYDSKELLFFDVFCILHDEIQEKLIADIKAITDKITPEKLTDIILDLYKALEDSFLLRLATNGELELLFRKLPPETTKIHTDKDDFRVEQLVSIVPGMKTEKIAVYSAAIRGIFVSMLHRKEIGEEVFDDALKIMIYGVVVQMFEDDNK
jgi:AcrR family transcriptional regulator